MIAAPLLAAVFPLTGTSFPAAGLSYLKLLGGAASPCALISLGLFLADKRPSPNGDRIACAWLIGQKLIAQPLLMWSLGKYLFHLPPALLQPATLLAALPTGTGPFMLAEYYRREADISAQVIIGSTILSVFTISLYLAFGR